MKIITYFFIILCCFLITGCFEQEQFDINKTLNYTPLPNITISEEVRNYSWSPNITQNSDIENNTSTT